MRAASLAALLLPVSAVLGLAGLFSSSRGHHWHPSNSMWRTVLDSYCFQRLDGAGSAAIPDSGDGIDSRIRKIIDVIFGSAGSSASFCRQR